jgi:flagellar biosynthesis/type III secretory pathway protein FliH
MTAPRIQRFDFGSLRDFRGPIVMKAMEDVVTEALPVEPPPAPHFNQEELDAARISGRKEGYQEGFLAGQQDAARATEQRLEDANRVIASLSGMLDDLGQRYEALLTEESKHLSSLISRISRKIAAEALDANGIAVITSIIERCLPVIFSKPRVSIELHPEMLESASTRIESQLQQSGYEGEIQFRSNHGMQPTDIVIDWGSGQLQRSTNALWEEIDALIERIPLEITFAETQNNNSTGE